ncbi:MAG TPA: aldehyde ferredoxin oxidoreductase family protein [Anaerolineae bacterium]|nr:aldehyde ferredoxin oxidoreductase family protein [Anaerolineae bacterium]
MSVNTIHAGRWLQVDLDSGEVSDIPIAEEQVRTWLLGDGIAAHLFSESLVPSLDPLDPASPLLVFNGLLTGSFGPGAARTSWCGRSPLTGIWGQANMGGRWGAELRFAGLDGVVITGRAPSPVYLWIHDGGLEIRDATHLWGTDTFETHERIREELDAKAQVACIGPAGENLVGVAGIMSGGQFGNRAAARSGMGALVGSKNLKAIAVRGDQKPSYADRARFHAAVREANALIQQGGKSLSLVGTAGGIPNVERHGDLPLKNWQEGSWPEGAQAISGMAIRETVRVRDTFCFACPLGCGKVIAIKEGPYAGIQGEGPEYETLGGFGGNLLIDDLPALLAINDLCNRVGLDTISTSGVVAFAIEAMEMGLIPADVAGGLRLQWGEPELVLELVGQIARREGLGALLADGVRAAASRLGPEAERFAHHVKGLELPYHDPRAFVALGLNYATGARGACHLEGPSHWRGFGWEWPGWMEGPHDRFASDAEAARVTIGFQDYLALFNALGLCKFMAMSRLDPARTVELVNAATGWDWDVDDLLRAGERQFNLKRLINLRLGITAEDDRLPRRFLTEPRPTGGAAGVVPDLDVMLRIYYELRGWDAQGRPTQETLARLGLT